MSGCLISKIKKPYKEVDDTDAQRYRWRGIFNLSGIGPVNRNFQLLLLHFFRSFRNVREANPAWKQRWISFGPEVSSFYHA